VAGELTAEIDPLPGASAIRDGWRGLIDFGELWSQDDAYLMVPPGAVVPIGDPLMYGCEVARDPTNSRRIRIRLLRSTSRGPS